MLRLKKQIYHISWRNVRNAKNLNSILIKKKEPLYVATVVLFNNLESLMTHLSGEVSKVKLPQAQTKTELVGNGILTYLITV